MTGHAVAAWFVYGDLVLDRLVGADRCEVVRVCCPEGVPPRPAVVREQLDLPEGLPVAVTDVLPRSVCTLDDVVLLPSGGLATRRATAPPANPADPADAVDPAVDLLTYDLRTEDILRLQRMHRAYPEIRFDPGLVEFLACATAHLRALAPSFDELALLIASNAPPDTAEGLGARPLVDP